MADNLDDILDVGRGARQPVVPPGHPSGNAGGDFPALHIIVGIHKVIAVIALVVGVVAALVVLAAPGVNALAVLPIVVAWTLLVPLFLWGSGEVILLFLRIEHNTRRAHEFLRESRSSKN